jgi:Rrf2 family nitric oxide-sensitive transcriptional repressor
MQFTRFTDYSLRALMYLGVRHDQLSTVKEIAEHYGISQNHLVKVVHNLSLLGYIESTKGKGGGIRLLKQADQINLRDLIVKLEPNLVLVECFDEKTNTCRITSACGLKHILHESLQAFTEKLGQYTLADTIQNPELFLFPEKSKNGEKK